jgi:hypothetical protein
MWEVTAQPGFALTWNGPCFQAGAAGSGIVPTVEGQFAAWPTYGVIPFYVQCTLPAVAVSNRVYGQIALSSSGVSANTLASTAASRLQTRFAANSVPLTVSASTGLAGTQKYSFTNTNGNATVYLDFSLNPSVTQISQYATKQGILQACKLLGFTPGQIFAVPPGATVVAPRAFQLGFRSQLDLYCYKTVRWVPEDTAAYMPSANDVAQGVYGTYFDCYSYQHFLNQCVNPTFKRCLVDPNDTAEPLSNQCLTRQITTLNTANTAAKNQWNGQTAYAVDTNVHYQGIAYRSLTANLGVPPVGSPSSSVTWLSAGASINHSYSDGVSYLVGDIVSFTNAAGNTYYSAANATTTGHPTVAGGSGWDPATSFYTGTLAPTLGLIGTLQPVISFSSATQLFSLNLDSYGFGGTEWANVDDGNFGFIDSPAKPSGGITSQALLLQQVSNATLNDIARDSWGLTGTSIVTTPAYTVSRGICYDERFVIECDDYFHQLFGNWPCVRLSYADPQTSITTSYIRYTPQAQYAGLNVPTPLPLVLPTVVSEAAPAFLPYYRVAGNQPYIYSFPQDYPSVGLAWNPVDTIVVVSGSVPIEDDQVAPLNFLGDTGVPLFLGTSGETLKVLAEFVVRPEGQAQCGQAYRNEIIYEPTIPQVLDMKPGRPFTQFDYALFWRDKRTQKLRPMSLSNGGCANLRWVFQRKT